MKPFLAILAVLALAVAAPASAENVVNTSIPLVLSTNNPCNGETVDLTGDAHIQARITLDGNGGIHAGIHINAHAQGSGATTSANYNGKALLNANLNANSGGAAEGTVILNLALIAQGKVPNFKLKVHLHVTVNANGDVTATVASVEPSCK